MIPESSRSMFLERIMNTELVINIKQTGNKDTIQAATIQHTLWPSVVQNNG
jgi:hypothetical protein